MILQKTQLFYPSAFEAPWKSDSAGSFYGTYLFRSLCGFWESKPFQQMGSKTAITMIFCPRFTKNKKCITLEWLQRRYQAFWRSLRIQKETSYLSQGPWTYQLYFSLNIITKCYYERIDYSKRNMFTSIVIVIKGKRSLDISYCKENVGRLKLAVDYMNRTWKRGFAGKKIVLSFRAMYHAAMGWSFHQWTDEEEQEDGS